MKIAPLIPVLTFALFTACAPTSPVATDPRPQKLANESAAAFAAKDYTKAQTLAAEVARLNPRFAEVWVADGMASVRLGQAGHAREAYERALSLYQARHHQNPSDTNPMVQQIFLLILLGRSVEAETLLQQARHDYPSDQQLSMFAGDFSRTKLGWENVSLGR